MRVLAVSNQKGGVGKTTTAIGLAAAFAERGLRVLALDLDPQANLTLGLGLEPGALDRGMFQVLVGEAELGAVARPTATERLWLAGADLTLAAAERRLLGEIGFDRILAGQLQALAARDAYDVAVIDCPPSLGLLTVNAIGAASLVLVPVQCEFFSARGLVQLFEVVQAVRARRHTQLALRVVPALYDGRNRICRQVLAELRAAWGAELCRTVLAVDTRVREAQAAGMPITSFAPRARAARAYRELAAELLAEATGSAGAGARAVRQGARAPRRLPPGAPAAARARGPAAPGPRREQPARAGP